jgi:hypothetical protein
MSESADTATGGEALVLVGYASLMESVQGFEWALKRIAIQEEEDLDSLSFDEVWKRAEKVFRKPIGALEGNVPQGLIDELPKLRRIRNKLAHEILLLWRFETNLGLTTHAEVVDSFVEIANELDAYTEQLDELADKHLVEIGLDPADLNPSAAKLRKILNDAAEASGDGFD